MSNEEAKYTEEEVMQILTEGLCYLNERFTKKNRLTNKDMYIIGAVGLSFKHHKEKTQKENEQARLP